MSKAPKTNSSKTSLVIVGPLPPPVYGQSLSFQMLAEGLRQRNIEHCAINIGSKVTTPGGKAHLRRALEYIFILSKYLGKICSGKKTVYITMAQSRQGFYRDFFMIWIACLFRLRIVLHLKGGNYRNFYLTQSLCLKWLIKMTLRRAESILVLGHRLRSMFDFAPGLAEKIHVVPNGLPFEQIDRIRAKHLPISPGDKAGIRILFLSNLVESKGYLGLLSAIKELRDRSIPVTCHFCGNFFTSFDDEKVKSADHARKLFENYVKENSLEKEVRLLGQVSGKEKMRELAESHIFVLPTRYANEGQPVSVIEAMAYGNVVIATDYRAIPEMVIHEETGILIPSQRPTAIADAIERLVMNPGLYEAMSKNALTRFQELFTREAHLNRIIPILLNQH